ncbi:MAG: glycosyltransferase family 1 protein [Rhizobacter sp.]|nr:glycosyltransferase family 1 protein [Rhizobacter sp.]
MRLFQNSAIYPGYRPRLDKLTHHCAGFTTYVNAFLDDRFGAPHFLLPVLTRDTSAFFTNGDDEVPQRLWANNHGLARDASLEAILLAQIEHHRTEVFYNMDPLRYGSAFVRKLPGCIKRSIAWRAAPSPRADFAAYDRVVCNFPSILDTYRERGWQAAYFAPAHDPEMDAYAANTERPIDVIFVGGYSRHHRQRAEILEAVAGQRKDAKLVFHLDRSRLTRLAESPPGRLLPLSKHRRPPQIRAVTADPLFGRSLYQALSQAKVVLNGAVDMAGIDRGNMRCFEAMGCGAMLLSDEGRYPDGMVAGQTLQTYRGAADAVAKIASALASPATSAGIAEAGNAMVRGRYSKQDQWDKFQALLE